MRFLVLFAVTVIDLIFTGAVFPNLNIYGIAPDIIICSMASLAALEKSMTGAIIGLICGLALDLMFTGAIGFFTLSYFVAGASLYFVSRHIRYIENMLLPVIFALGAFLIKELVQTVLAYMLGLSFSLSHQFIRYMLPEMLVTGAFMLLVHLILRRLYQSNSIRPKGMEDIKRLL